MIFVLYRFSRFFTVMLWRISVWDIVIMVIRRINTNGNKQDYLVEWIIMIVIFKSLMKRKSVFKENNISRKMKGL